MLENLLKTSKTEYFIDTEFIEDGKTIDLISIGICSEDREYYAINYDCDFSRANNWVKENVLPFIPEKPMPQQYGTPEKFRQSKEYRQGWRNKGLIAQEISEFVVAENNPIFWGYYADYDWVVFCQLFGKMIDLPPGFPMYCNDVKQYAMHLGNPDLPKQKDGLHHALEDAKHVRKMWEFLQQRRHRNGREYQ